MVWFCLNNHKFRLDCESYTLSRIGILSLRFRNHKSSRCNHFSQWSNLLDSNFKSIKSIGISIRVKSGSIRISFKNNNCFIHSHCSWCLPNHLLFFNASYYHSFYLRYFSGSYYYWNNSFHSKLNFMSSNNLLVTW